MAGRVEAVGRATLLAFVAVLATLMTSARIHATKQPEALQRFLALDDPEPVQFRALRRLTAHNDHFGTSAEMEVWTEADRTGFRYEVVSEDGSEYIRTHVFRPSLESERQMWISGAIGRASLTPDNYEFVDRGVHGDGLLSLGVKPRRKDVLLVDGAIFLSAEDADLVRVEGRLSKAPSMWTRRVDVVRWYKRFAGVRMPVALESVANVLVAGRSTLRMTYDYETVNGQLVGAPRARAALR